MRAPTSESELAAMWLAHASRVGPLRDSRGRSVEVIYPGRLVGLPGPDLIDAIVAIDHGLARRVTVELHIDEVSWARHGHTRDPAYAEVDLHVIWNPLPRAPQQYPPSICVADAFAGLRQAAVTATDFQPAVFLCRPPLSDDRQPRSAVLSMVEHQGERRLAERTDAMEADIEALGPDHALYRAVMRALGYRQNVAAFGELAAQAPLGLLEQVAVGSVSRRVLRAESVLLGLAGLLPSQRGIRATARFVLELDACWRELGRLAGMRRSDWVHLSVRPVNWPARRIAAAARIFTRAHGPNGTFAEMVLAEILRAADLRDTSALAAWFQVRVDANSLWARHYDFDKPARRPAPQMVGRARASEILVNAALPFAAAVGRRRGRADLASASASILRELPANGWNQYTTYMADTLRIGRRGLGSAAAQQGLLRLFHRWCRDKRCESCPAARVMSDALSSVLPS